MEAAVFQKREYLGIKTFNKNCQLKNMHFLSKSINSVSAWSTKTLNFMINRRESKNKTAELAYTCQF